tara:strand:- start:5 stop:229 length:225 start_codon:yes stop_codon:yes gene_type:complete
MPGESREVDGTHVLKSAEWIGDAVLQIGKDCRFLENEFEERGGFTIEDVEPWNRVLEREARVPRSEKQYISKRR